MVICNAIRGTPTHLGHRIAYAIEITQKIFRTDKFAKLLWNLERGKNLVEPFAYLKCVPRNSSGMPAQAEHGQGCPLTVPEPLFPVKVNFVLQLSIVLEILACCVPCKHLTPCIWSAISFVPRQMYSKYTITGADATRKVTHHTCSGLPLMVAGTIFRPSSRGSWTSGWEELLPLVF